MLEKNKEIKKLKEKIAVLNRVIESMSYKAYNPNYMVWDDDLSNAWRLGDYSKDMNKCRKKYIKVLKEYYAKELKQ